VHGARLAGRCRSRSPANDSFANAQPISGASVAGSNVDATTEPGEAFAGVAGGASVWFT
jgi:hypothetical protein